MIFVSDRIIHITKPRPEKSGLKVRTWAAKLREQGNLKPEESLPILVTAYAHMLLTNGRDRPLRFVGGRGDTGSLHSLLSTLPFDSIVSADHIDTAAKSLGVTIVWDAPKDRHGREIRDDYSKNSQ